jgi:hypothetical protein
MEKKHGQRKTNRSPHWIMTRVRWFFRLLDGQRSGNGKAGAGAMAPVPAVSGCNDPSALIMANQWKRSTVSVRLTVLLI